MMQSDDDVTGPINLGNPTEFTMLELADLVTELTNSTSPVVFEDLPMDDPKQRKPDISKAEKYLNYQVRIALEAGIKTTVEEFRIRMASSR